MQSNYLIWYHNEDNDGVFSAAIIYNYLVHEINIDKQNITLEGTTYNILKNKYSSNEDTQIQHDGTLLSKTGITLEQIQCEVAFDITITLKSGISYKGTVTLNLPAGNLIDEGTSSTEITDFSNVVFKRI